MNKEKIGGQGVNININPLEYPEVKCDKCGCKIFSPGVMFRAIPGILVGAAGQTQYADQRVMYCVECHELSPMDKEFMKIAEERMKNASKSPTPKPENETESGIIFPDFQA